MRTNNRFKKKFTGKMKIQKIYYLLATTLFIAVSSSFSQVTYSGTWNIYSGNEPWGNKLHMCSAANATATIQDTGTEAFVIYRAAPEGGIFQAVVDGKPETMKEVDTYAPSILWNKKTVIAANLANGPHTIVVTVTGKKNPKSSNTTISIVDKWILGRGMWSPEKAWVWYKSKPWIVGWNYTPTTCVNTMEWWQDEKKVNDSIINRELRIGECLGYNTVIVYLQYLVWLKDSAYCKDRLNKFLALADAHHMTVSPVFFDDVNFICSGDNCGNSHLGDQGEPNPNLLMSQWGASPGPTYVLDASQRPNFKRYVQDFIRTFGQDKRILMWDLYNEPSNSGMGTRTYPLVELAFQWAREIGSSQPLTVSEWTGQGNNSWPYNLSDVISFHGYMDKNGLSNTINSYRTTQRPIICSEWLARQAGTNILTDFALFKRLGVGAIQWSLINGRMHCERAWPMYGSSNDPWFHDVLYNNGKPYRADEVDAILRNLAHKTINWVNVNDSTGAMVVKNGCTDPRYAEYDSMANVDAGCSKLAPALVIRGCTDPASKNYNPFATVSDPAACTATAVVQPQAAEIAKVASKEIFSFIGKNRIRIFAQGTSLVELFSINGRLAWSGKVEGPCILDISKSLKNGIYCARISSKDGNAAVTPMFRVIDQR